MLAMTGNLSFLGPPEVTAAKLAISDINAACGVLSQPAELFETGSGDTLDRYCRGVGGKLIQRGVSVIVDPASSALTET